MYEDKILVCKECGNEFTFTAGEQEFYAERGFQNEPQRAASASPRCASSRADCQLIQRAPQAGALFVCLRGTIGKRKGATAGCADSSPGWWPRNRQSGTMNVRKE